MKILNREKTHFMQPNADGIYDVKFGAVADVHALIDSILDAKPNTSATNLTVVDTQQVELLLLKMRKHASI